MAHTIYRTNALVLGVLPIGESHQYLTLFTQELGLIRAHARSVRKESSKLRYHIQEFTYGQFALVRGRDVWRVTGAREEWNGFYALRDDPAKTALLVRNLRLLNRLLQGEGEQPELFLLLERGLSFLRSGRVNDELLQNFEYLLVLKSLLVLGYVDEQGALSGILKVDTFNSDVLARLSPLRREILFEINRAIYESQL